MHVKDWLRDFHSAKQYAFECAQRLDEARNSPLKAQRYDIASKGPDTFSLDRTVAKIEAEEKRFRKAKENLFSRLDELADMIEQLEDYDQKLVLMYRYLLGKKWSEIVKEMPYCERSVQRIHGIALKALQNVLNTKEESKND